MQVENVKYIVPISSKWLFFVGILNYLYKTLLIIATI